MISKKSVNDVDVSGKNVLVRVDFNEPVEGGKLLDDFKIRSAIPTIKYLLEKNAKVILVSHLGRPYGKDPAYSLAIVVPALESMLKRSVLFVPDVRGEKVKEAVRGAYPGDVVLLENVRFYQEEEENDQGFAEELASLADIFVNDAFAAAHRAHATTVGVAAFLPAVAGLLMQKEIDSLTRAMSKYRVPLVFIIAGGKVSTKIGLLESFAGKANTIIIGGAMANTFLVGEGKDLGKSIYEPEMVATAAKLLKDFGARGVRVVLPVDGVVTDEISEKGKARAIGGLSEIKPGEYLVDIAGKTLELIKSALGGAGTVIWNGPLGVSEFEQFSKGSIEAAKVIAASGADTYVGGGDTAEIVQKAGLLDKFTFVSTGGGAALEFLEGKELPGIAVLEDKV